jgi:hypothetical protein
MSVHVSDPLAICLEICSLAVGLDPGLSRRLILAVGDKVAILCELDLFLHLFAGVLGSGGLGLFEKELGQAQLLNVGMFDVRIGACG